MANKTRYFIITSLLSLLMLIITPSYTNQHKYLPEAPQSPSTAGQGSGLQTFNLILYQALYQIARLLLTSAPRVRLVSYKRKRA